MAFFKKKTSKETTVALRDDAPVAYTKEKSKIKGDKEVRKVKSEYDDGKGTHGVLKTKLKKKEKDNVSKKEAETLSAVTETKLNDSGYSQTKTVQSSYAYSATFSGTPEEIAKQKKKMEKDMEKKRKDIEKQRKKLMK